ncbi:MAG: hypothetical protein WC820_01965 [Spirochaetales bacterium]
MKKSIIAFALACLIGGAAYAQIPVNMDKGDLAVAAGVNFGWDYGVGGSVEYMFARVDIADAVPLTFGVAVRGGVDFIYTTNYTVVGLATLHWSLGFISELPLWLKKFDFYYGLGLGVGAGSTFGIGIGNSAGIAYYLNHNLALYTSVIYVRFFEPGGGGSGFGSFGLIFKL